MRENTVDVLECPEPCTSHNNCQYVRGNFPTVTQNDLRQSPPDLHLGIFHFHIRHQQACCQGWARTGSGTHGARANDECCWNEEQWSCTLCARIPLPNELHRYGKWVVRAAMVPGLVIPSDCHRQRGRLREGSERKRRDRSWATAATSKSHDRSYGVIRFSPQRHGSCLILRNVKDVRVPLLLKVKLLWLWWPCGVWAEGCGSQDGTTSYLRGVILREGREQLGNRIGEEQ